jgi:predicted nucleotidyltransferase component of viral defense system
LLEEIEKLLEQFVNDELFNEYYFLGGTALSYYLNHRISYDIDFITSKKLDSEKLKTLSIVYGAKYIPDKDLAVFRINSGDNLENYKMSFNFDGIKVEFFYPNDAIRVSLLKQGIQKSQTIYKNIKILPLKTIAYLKLLAFFRRTKIRDLFDVTVLLEKDILDVDEIERYMALEYNNLTFPEFVENFKDDGSETLDFSHQNSYYEEFKDISNTQKQSYLQEKLIKIFVQKSLQRERK